MRQKTNSIFPELFSLETETPKDEKANKNVVLQQNLWVKIDWNRLRR